MADSIGSIFVSIGLDHAAYLAGIGAVKASTTSTANSIDTDLSAAAKNAAAALAALGAAGAKSSEGIAKSTDEIKDFQKSADDLNKNANFDTFSQKLSYAIGTGVGVGLATGQKAFDGFVEYSKTKALVIGAAVGIALTAIGAGALYTAYKLVTGTTEAIKGLINGDFYKSESIDALIKTNDVLLDIQKNLHLSSIEAGALNNALDRVGVSKDVYTRTTQAVTNAQRERPQDLEDLGVKVREVARPSNDFNGSLLPSQEVLKNAKDLLDQYTEGWDRNKKAVELGLGSYDDIVQTLKISDAQLEQSKKRLDDYGLGISVEFQADVEAYQKSIREFNNESELMSQGFKKVVADAILPLYADLASVFKDGFPSIVAGFRVVVSTLVGLLYAVEDGFYALYKSVETSARVIAIGIIAIGDASAKAATGDFSGGAKALKNGYELSVAAAKQGADDVVKQVLENDKKIKLAIGADGRDASIADSKLTTTQLKNFVPKPDIPEKDPAEDRTEKTLKRQLDQQIAIINQFAAARKEAVDYANAALQSAYDDGTLSLAAQFGEQNRLRDVQLQTEVTKYNDSIKAYQDYKAKTERPDAKIEADTKIIEAIGKRTAAINKAAQDDVLATAQQTRAVKQLDDQYNSLIATVKTLRGDTSGAGQININRQVTDAQKLVTNQGGDQSIVTDLRKQLELTLSLNEATKEYSKLTEKASNSEENLILDAKQNGDSELKTLQAVKEARQQALIQLAALANRAQELANISSNPDAQVFADKLALQFKKASAEVDPLLNKLKSIGDEASKDTAGAFADFITGAKTAKDAIKDLENQLIQLITKNLVTNPLGDFFSNLLGGKPGGSSGGGFDLIGSIAGFFGGGRASGGSVTAGGLYRVNENRPEMLDVNGKQFLMMGGQNGRVDPNPNFGGGRSTGPISIVVNVPDSTSRQSASQIAAQTGAAVNRAVRRNS